jgi:hypothetical protein
MAFRNKGRDFVNLSQRLHFFIQIDLSCSSDNPESTNSDIITLNVMRQRLGISALSLRPPRAAVLAEVHGLLRTLIRAILGCGKTPFTDGYTLYSWETELGA